MEDRASLRSGPHSGLTAPVRPRILDRVWGWGGRQRQKTQAGCARAQRGSSTISEPNMSETPVDKAERETCREDMSPAIRTAPRSYVTARVADTRG